VEVVPDVDIGGSNPFMDVVIDEMLGQYPRELEIEWFGDHDIETEGFEGLSLLFEGIEQPKIPFRLEHTAGMGLERIEDRFALECPRPTDHEVQDRLMPEMQAVEITQGQHGTRELTRQGRNASKDLQALSSFASFARLLFVRILSHYFIARYLGLFTTVLVAAVLILSTIELVLNLDDLAAFGASAESDSALLGFAGIASALRVLWVRLASYYLADLLPIASFVAVFVTLAWAGRAMELVAIQTGGIRLGRILAPILGTALILSFATALLHETLILDARQVWANEMRSDRNGIDFSREAFWYHKGRTITNISRADPETRTLHQVEIFERGLNGVIIRVIRADHVRIGTDGVWHIEDASIWRFDPEKPLRHPDLREHVSMALDLDALHGDAMLAADPALLPLPELAGYLERNAQSQETTSTGRGLASRYHDRLSQPWLVLLFAWMAMPFALRINESGRFGRPAAKAVAILGLFFLLQSAGTTLARQALFPLGATPWLMIALFGFGTAIALRRQPI
jgi:lipopolysaccharide export system permease protein